MTLELCTLEALPSKTSMSAPVLRWGESDSLIVPSPTHPTHMQEIKIKSQDSVGQPDG